MVDLVQSSKNFSKLFTSLLIQHKIIESICMFWMKSHQNLHQNSHPFQKKSSEVPSSNATTCLYLDQIGYCGNILKQLSKDNICLNNVINIANVCIKSSSSSIIIPKLNKASYNSPKIFCPIVLLNILRKLIEKVIEDRLQFQAISNNFVYPNQLGGLKQHSTTNAGNFLTHFIQSE